MKYVLTTCFDCVKKIGYKLNDGATKRCRPCRTQYNAIHPVTGYRHKDKAKFRKFSYSNVNYDDRIVEFSPAGNPRKKYRMKCKDCGEDRGYQTNKDALRLCKKCRDKNVTKYTYEQKRIRCAMKANLVARLKQRLINKNKKSTFECLNYSVDELKIHLESKFQLGMSWDNYGEWHIDHITPDSWFEYNSFEDEGFKKSWALENLQPLWAKDNQSKGNRRSG